jgi:hypothetical protein
LAEGCYKGGIKPQRRSANVGLANLDMLRDCINKTVTRLEKLDGIAVITFKMSFALAAMLNVYSTWTSLISMLLAYFNRPVNMNLEKEMTKTTRNGRPIADAGY